ncbi:MAG: hypothetical protein LAP39_02555 [Acidobacteriia bacterium]|nr:hypothetical protein [Terriglobia bacterium]
MKLKMRFCTGALLAPFLMAAFISPAGAQATRTWISGVGDDANPCSRTAPCKTWAGAISKTAAGGEIDALDPGGFGALTITKPITLDGGGGQVASVLVAGTNGLVVATTGATDIVIIRNLRLDGLSQPTTGGLNGILIVAGANVRLENLDIFGFSTFGVQVNATSSVNLTVDNVTISAGPNATATGGGISMTTTSGMASADIGNTRIYGTHPALQGRAKSVWSVHDSDLSFNGVAVKALEAGSTINLSHCQLNNNATAVQSVSGSIIRVTGSTLRENGTAFDANGGALLSDSQNDADGNGTNGAATGSTTKL